MYAILRTYNTPQVKDLLRRLNSWRHLDGCVVVINAEEDQINSEWISRGVHESKPIKVLQLRDYGWARAINAGLRELPADMVQDELVLIISNEVQITTDDLDELRSAAIRPGASCGYALFKDFETTSFRVPRNTCALWNRKLISALGPFDESLDEDTGMEDYEMALRTFHRTGLLPAIGPRDVVLDRTKGEEFAKKLSREERSMDLIEARYPTWVTEQVRTHLAQENKSQI